MAELFRRGVAPSGQLENYLEAFLRGHGRDDLALVMHSSIARRAL
jgi:hypothetical protein